MSKLTASAPLGSTVTQRVGRQRELRPDLLASAVHGWSSRRLIQDDAATVATYTPSNDDSSTLPTALTAIGQLHRRAVQDRTTRPLIRPRHRRPESALGVPWIRMTMLSCDVAASGLLARLRVNMPISA